MSVDRLAAAAGVSRQHLTRIFREVMGVSPKRYCRLARFHAALAYAGAGSGVQWAEVAADLGYADQSHLCRELRRYTGFSPQQLWRCVPDDDDLWVYKAWFGWSGARNDMPDFSDAHA